MVSVTAVGMLTVKVVLVEQFPSVTVAVSVCVPASVLEYDAVAVTGPGAVPVLVEPIDVVPSANEMVRVPLPPLAVAERVVDEPLQGGLVVDAVIESAGGLLRVNVELVVQFEPSVAVTVRVCVPATVVE
jgi:hypothetical protein